MTFRHNTSYDFEMLGMGLSLSEADIEVINAKDICEISRWEDEGGAIPAITR